ncbi:MAG TPA: PilZ domain-containing protein [Candidatus Accumulibacter phosphatis]|nr:MAG: hypothetical protein AW07_04035 [Candidatus Accumulibacter sp. SK-11]HAY28838.1 PilZ domain-containing protein [Accumulibacter sp.]HCN68998.1 PilZ domain-containing protein [Accumulibacter sp.]HRL77433.1 PilZ domain-containing protein [Candidatus Accumulibacter phosphatis]HRQ96714.1 PilZ domain-containing protein [Candidatus Accumulibacter phosphatis]
MASTETHRRGFIRHPADIPVDIAVGGAHRRAAPRMKDVSEGGLACLSRRPLSVGATVVLSIPLVQPPFRATGEVVWCRRQGSAYEVGIRFADADDFFAARMVEQVCQIERYRQQVRRDEGRVLDAEAAAREWIERYAAGFPVLGNLNTH